MNLLTGLVAGAAGTVALNVTTYLDMAIRARPASSTPSKVVGKLIERVGVDVRSQQMDDCHLQNRLSGLGALSGYATGLTVGAAYGLMKSDGSKTSILGSGVGLGLAAMAGSDVPATALGVTDPRSWSRQSWLADIVPHLAYGLTTAAVFKAFSKR